MTTRTRTPEAEATDVRYIRNHMLWPALVLPLVKRDGSRACAYMLKGSDYTNGKPVLRHGNLFNMKDSDVEETFESPEAVLNAGWEVD